MGVPGAKQGDKVVGVDTHVIMIPSPGGPVPTPMPMPFTGTLDGALASSIMIDNKPAATKGSTASNQPQHIPAGGPFQTPPTNQGTVDAGSDSVFFDGAKAARMGDQVKTCNDPTEAPNGVIIAAGTVLIG
ncbi:MAG: PAAR domain-containing protein [Minicystis sp.]